jgi:glycosyltransferase involved in cell wall biosynthesis
MTCPASTRAARRGWDMDADRSGCREVLVDHARGVLIIGNHLSGTVGARSVCEDLSLQLRNVGWPVVTASHRRIRVLRLMDMLYTIVRARRAYGTADVEVYSGAAFLWAEAACAVLRWLGKPFILTLHGGNLPAFAERWPGRVRRLLQSAAVVTTPSAYLQERMRPYRDDLRLLPNALPLGKYTFRLRQRPQPRLIWLRAFHQIYNPTLAVEVVAALASSFPEIRLVMVGPDKGDGSWQRTRERAAARGISDRIALPGGIPKGEVPIWMDRADIFLNTTSVDNTPISVLEAMASGLCVVSTNVGGIPFLLEDGQNALLVPPNDSEAMAGAVQRILTEPCLAEQLSRNAHATAESFDWSEVLPRWESLLASVAAQRAASRAGSGKRRTWP